MNIIKENLRFTVVALSIIVAAIMVGTSILIAASFISDAIRAKDPSLTERAAQDFVRRQQRRPPVAAPAAVPQKPGSKVIKGVTAGSNAIKGDAKAPVLLVEFSDFQCPFSKRFYSGAFAQLDKEYIASGKVKFAYRDFPLGFHPLANPAAVACECAGEQNKYWDMFDKLNTAVTFNETSFTEFAKDIKLDMKKYTNCYTNKKPQANIDEDLAAARAYGVSGTPAFFINGRFIEGAYPYEAFKSIIDEELSKAEPASKK